MTTPLHHDHATGHDIGISRESNHWDSISDIDALVEDTITRTLDAAMPSDMYAEISIVLADDTFVQNLNKIYRGKDKPTNVLSFPQSEPDDLDSEILFIPLGDIIVAYETLERESKEQHKAFTDHLRHMLVHGCLHLLHYNHENESQANAMETLEIYILNGMNVKNPYEID